MKKQTQNKPKAKPISKAKNAAAFDRRKRPITACRGYMICSQNALKKDYTASGQAVAGKNKSPYSIRAQENGRYWT